MTLPGQQTDRLRWQCRRGMLELDYLLETYLDHAYAALTSREKVLFEDILNNHDPDLQSWLLGDEDAPQQYRTMMKHILETSRQINSR